MVHLRIVCIHIVFILHGQGHNSIEDQVFAYHWHHHPSAHSVLQGTRVSRLLGWAQALPLKNRFKMSIVIEG